MGEELSYRNKQLVRAYIIHSLMQLERLAFDDKETRWCFPWLKNVDGELKLKLRQEYDEQVMRIYEFLFPET
jgi:hypothetical protein